MLDFWLHEHNLSDLATEVPALPDMLPAARAGWTALASWNKLDPLQGLQLFTDGSFFPSSQVAGWSVVVLGTCAGRVVRLGFQCGTCPGTSAYQGELCALAHARAIALSARPLPVAIASDCTSALQVAFGAAGFEHTDDCARALASLSLASCAFHQPVMPLHIRSHTGCVFNDTADALAKGAARGAICDGLFVKAEAFWAGVHERFCDWVWLLAPQFLSSAQLPSLTPGGSWTKASCEAPPSTNVDPDILQPAPCPTTGQVELCVRALQYNCLSLRGAPAQELMIKGLRRHSVQAAFFQETRLGATGVGANDDFWVLSAPCTDAGVGGCQVWLNRRATIVTGSSQSWCWNRASFTILHASPQLLVATAAAGPLHFGLVSGHAPSATAPEHVRQAWWSLLSEQIRRLPRRHVLVAGLDANARFRHTDSPSLPVVESAPTCCNSRALADFSSEFGLVSQMPVSITGQPIKTWTSPAGKDGLIDYVLVPSDWQSALDTLDMPDLQDQHCGFDHWPLLVKVKTCTTGELEPSTVTFCRRALATSEGQQVAAAAVATLPQVSWDTDISTHVQIFHRHLHAKLVRELPHVPMPARHPAVSEPTLDLVRRHRHCRQVLKAASRQHRRAQLHAILTAWRVGTASLRQRRACKAAADRLAIICAETLRVGKWVRNAMLFDKAAFSRAQIAAARGAGPAKFAHLLRAITRQGRRFKPPKVLPVIQQDGKAHIGQLAVTKVLGASYATAERALPVQPASFVSTCQTGRLLQTPLEAAGSPSPVDLIRGFLGLRSGRAPGRSQLPAEVYASNPVSAALAYGPVILKLLARGVNPVQWSGGVAHSIPKGSKDPGSVQGWRAILLLETDAKAYQKAWRPQAIRALEPVRAVGQHGGIPQHTLEQPAALARAHLQGLSATGKSGGALFVDCAAAYYSIVRDFFFAGPHHRWTPDELAHRSRLFFTESADQERFTAEMQAGDWLRALQLPVDLHRIVMAQLQDTWYIDGSPGTTLYSTRSGTAPGSPVADALFAFLFSRFLAGH